MLASIESLHHQARPAISRAEVQFTAGAANCGATPGFRESRTEPLDDEGLTIIFDLDNCTRSLSSSRTLLYYLLCQQSKHFTPAVIIMSKTFTKADVAAHKDESTGMYIIVDDSVYDITGAYLSIHSSYFYVYFIFANKLQASLMTIPAAQRSSSASLARTPPSRFGSTTASRCWRSMAAS